MPFFQGQQGSSNGAHPSTSSLAQILPSEDEIAGTIFN